MPSAWGRLADGVADAVPKWFEDRGKPRPTEPLFTDEHGRPPATAELKLCELAPFDVALSDCPALRGKLCGAVGDRTPDL